MHTSRLPTGYRLILLAALAFLLNACAHQSTQMPGNISEAPSLPEAPPIQTQWESYQQTLGGIEFWQVQGKLGIRTPDDSGSAYLNWKQLPKQFAIHLNGPLGQGSIWVRGNDSQVSLARSGEETLYAPTPEQLMYNAMGWWLPVSDLYYWVKGIPAPGKPIEEKQHNSDGTLHSLTQNHWQLSYPRYQQLDGWYLPTKVVAQYDSPNQEGEIKLTFIIKDWQLNDSSLDDSRSSSAP